MTSETLLSFPYKRKYLNLDYLWNNLITLDLVSPKLMEAPNYWIRPTKYLYYNMFNLNHNYTLVFIIPDDAYDKLNVLTDYFTEEARMKAKRKGNITPYQFYYKNYEKLVKQGEEMMGNVKVGERLPLEHYVREAIYLSNCECNTFNIALAKSIYKFFNSKIVLDPSAGWGDRILGAIGAGVEVYHGVDPNGNLINGYNEILNMIKKRTGNDKYLLYIEDFLNVEVPENSYDTVFTSPPFYDYEIYSEETNQSIYGKKTIEEWLNLFLYPYLMKSWQALIYNGYLILYVSDVKNTYFVGKMHSYIINTLKMNFLGIAAWTDSSLSKSHPIWCYQKRIVKV